MKKYQNHPNNHPFEHLKIKYVYILTAYDEDTAILDVFGYQQVKMTEKTTMIDCNEGWDNCFNFLLKENRQFTISSNDHRIKEVIFYTTKNDAFEHHKHPREFAHPIEKDEVVDWNYYGQYIMYAPTKEKIDEVREKKWWDSKDKALMAFFRSVYAPHQNELTLYVPDWLGKYEYSRTCKRYNFDGPYIDEKTLKDIGVTVNREMSSNASPVEDLKKLGHTDLENFSYFHSNYYKTHLVYSCDKMTPAVTNLIMSVGILMPTAAEWKKHVQKT